jgi:hypothetical protein
MISIMTVQRIATYQNIFFGLSQLRQNVNVGRTLEHNTHWRNLRRTQLFTFGNNKPFNFLIRFCGNFHDF